MISQDIRRGFLNYFKKQNHSVIPSAPLLPHDDPTLLFTNAGMNQFKDVFLGKSKRSYTRATTTQKCIRAGGKHNDLENVGFTSRHLTFFEMLGNFSFGDYFKKEAIAFAYDVITNVFKFDPDRIWPTVFKDDDEAFALWEEYFPSKKIIRFGEEENFWAMGDTGPCGPCSELLYDRGKSYSDATSPLQDITGERYLEFWNLVFMQYNRSEKGVLTPLPKPCVDTGTGLERIVSLKMNVDSVYATDIFQFLIKEIEKISKVKYDEKNKDLAPSFHIIADHIRCLAFAIADGIIPSNVDRGYVLRKILRRAARNGKTLGMEKPFLAKLLPGLISIMGDDFPELKTSEKRTAEILTIEEEAFIKNLKRGGNIMQQVISSAKKENKKISGKEAFKLKDTYGFPVEEVLLLAKDEHLDVDLKEFDKLEKEAKERSRKAQDIISQKFDENFFADFTKTHKPSKFAGYKTYKKNANIIAIIQGEKFTDTLKENELGILILDHTPFYAEMGGQIGDGGTITKNESLFEVKDTQSPYPGVVIHIGKLKKGILHKQDKITAQIDIERRKNIEANHSATHILHWALCEVLGPHVKQTGSLVENTRLRFDFDHHKAMTTKELRKTERLVNEKIRENVQIKDYEIPYEEAQKDAKIKQFFGEKYSDIVRVIDLGFSKELCGGAHSSYTGDIGYFRISKESSIAAGIRRIEAVTGSYAEDFVYDTEDLLNNISSCLKVTPVKLEERVNILLEEKKALEKTFKEIKQKSIKDLISSISSKKEKIGSYDVILQEIDLDPKDLNSFSDELIKKSKSTIVILASKINSRCQFYIKVPQDILDKGIYANELIKEIAPIIKGGGGGRKDSAQAGGKDSSKIKEAFEKIKQILEK